VARPAGVGRGIKGERELSTSMTGARIQAGFRKDTRIQNPLAKKVRESSTHMGCTVPGAKGEWAKMRRRN